MCRATSRGYRRGRDQQLYGPDGPVPVGVAGPVVSAAPVVPVGPVSGGPEKTEIDQQNSLSTSLVHELQRKAARSITGDDTTIKTDIKI